jgi:hypothetical protein
MAINFVVRNTPEKQLANRVAPIAFRPVFVTECNIETYWCNEFTDRRILTAPVAAPNHREVNLSTGQHFHLTSLNSAYCVGPDASKPEAPFNASSTMPNPALESISQASRSTLPPAIFLNAALLEGGNNQAHQATGNKPRSAGQ